MTTLERLEAALAAIQNMPPGKYTPQGHNYWAGVKVNLINLIAAEKARLAEETEKAIQAEKLEEL
jgi:phosphopentomutase